MSDETQGVFPAHLATYQLEQHPSRIEDVERGVVFVPWPLPPRAGARVRLDLEVGNEPPAAVDALVVWSRPARAGIVAGFGAQLVNPPDSLLHHIQLLANQARTALAGKEPKLAGPPPTALPLDDALPLQTPASSLAPAKSPAGQVIAGDSKGETSRRSRRVALPNSPIDQSPDSEEKEAKSQWLQYQGAVELDPEDLGAGVADSPLELASPDHAPSPIAGDDPALSLLDAGSHVELAPEADGVPPLGAAPADFDGDGDLSATGTPTPFPLGDLQSSHQSVRPSNPSTPSDSSEVWLDGGSPPPLLGDSQDWDSQAPQSPLDHSHTPPPDPADLGLEPAPDSMLRPGDRLLPIFLLAKRGEAGATLEKSEESYANPLDFLKPMEPTSEPTSGSRRRIRVQHPDRPPPTPSPPESTTPLAPDGMPAFSTSHLDDLGFDPGTEALLPSLPYVENDDEEAEDIAAGPSPSDVNSEKDRADHPPVTRAFIDELITAHMTGPVRRLVAPEHEAGPKQGAPAPPPKPEDDSTASADPVLPSLEDFESALDELGQGSSPLEASSETAAPRRIRFDGAHDYLAEYAASFEHGVVKIETDVLPELGEQVPLEIEVPDGEPVLLVFAEVDRYLTTEDLTVIGWEGRLLDPDGDVADRLGSAAFALM